MDLQDRIMNSLRTAQKFITTIHVFSVGMMKYSHSTQVIGIGVQFTKEQKNNTFVKDLLPHYKFSKKYQIDYNEGNIFYKRKF